MGVEFTARLARPSQSLRACHPTKPQSVPSYKARACHPNKASESFSTSIQVYLKIESRAEIWRYGRHFPGDFVSKRPLQGALLADDFLSGSG